MEWNDRYAIGIEEIDNQHKALFRPSIEWSLLWNPEISPATSVPVPRP